MKPKVAIIMGSISDWKILKDSEECLKSFGVKAHVEVVSAHRSPQKMFDFAIDAEKSGFEVIIAGAGGAAHLPGMVASLTNLPVIGVPIQATALEGLDSILSIVQMPKGIPVATVALDGAWNAGLLAVKILALLQPSLKKKLSLQLKKNPVKVKEMNLELKSKKNKRS
jgi:5-(carboxyamino)imidazole ribonucleotide mutase